MNIILLSGGSGQRLWPLSNSVRSKQFIKIFKTADGGYESMVQRVYRQLRRLDAEAKIIIAAPKAQASALNNQLGEGISISIEPSRRDTFPAIALASTYLHDVEGVSTDEPVVVCPVDPYVDESYFKTLRELGKQAEEGKANLVLMGIEPTYPSEKYGYILPNSSKSVSSVSGFKEKPNAEVAARYIKQGALWNGGVFAYKLGYMLDKAHELIDFVDYQDLFLKYDSLTKISLDYAVVEKEPSIQVMRYSGSWKDLGTWNTLTEAVDGNCIGQAIMDTVCKNVHIINELKVPILAMGLRDVVISASPDGILVSDKERSSHIKPFIDQISQKVMFSEKSWGSYRVLNLEKDSLTIKVTLLPGHRMNYHSHQKRDEVWTVISGHGRTVIDGMEQAVCAGDVITIRSGCRHTILAETELQMIEVQLGQEISVHDKQKYPLE